MLASNVESAVNNAVNNRYVNVDKTKKDVFKTIRNYRGLLPKLDKFVFRSGTSRYLLSLEGTIPVVFKGSSYNIPICIWLLDNHPLSSPMVYVKPTQDMLIKPSRHVDQNGKVYLPYLHEWNPNSSDLLGLIQVMIMTFGDMPPVYAKPRNAAPTPGYPVHPGGYMPMPGSAVAGLPYPPGSPANSAPFGQYPPNPPAYSANTPYPVYPPTSGAYPNPAQPPPPYSSAGGSFPPYPTTTTALPTGNDNSSNGPSPTNTTSNATITEEHIKASLLSCVSDRIRARLREIYEASQAEVSVLRQQQVDLTQGKTKLEGLISKLEQEQVELDRGLRLLKEKETEMNSILSKLSDATDPLDIDEAVTTTAPLYKQLLNAYAEDQATQDAIYYLGEALRRDIIDLDTFLKHVRSLSRKQFQLRALMSKCRERANMAG